MDSCLQLLRNATETSGYAPLIAPFFTTPGVILIQNSIPRSSGYNKDLIQCMAEAEDSSFQRNTPLCSLFHSLLSMKTDYASEIRHLEEKLDVMLDLYEMSLDHFLSMEDVLVNMRKQIDGVDAELKHMEKKEAVEKAARRLRGNSTTTTILPGQGSLGRMDVDELDTTPKRNSHASSFDWNQINRTEKRVARPLPRKQPTDRNTLSFISLSESEFASSPKSVAECEVSRWI